MYNAFKVSVFVSIINSDVVCLNTDVSCPDVRSKYSVFFFSLFICQDCNCAFELGGQRHVLAGDPCYM